MTTAGQLPQPTRTIRSRVPWLSDLTIVGAAGIAALVVWLVGRVTPTVPIGDEARPVTVWAVLASALIGSLVGIIALRLLERFTTKALLTWTVLAGVFTVFSLIAPLGATTTGGVATLMALHVVVAVVTVIGVWRARKTFGEAG